MKRGFLILGCVAFLVGGTLTAYGQAGGTITGKVNFTGTASPNRLIQMGADPNCLKINAGKKVYQEVVVVNPNKTLKNVFVHIKSGLEGKTFSPPKEPALIDQQGCIYHPRVTGVMLGQTLRVKNSDPTLHNVHAWSQKGNSFNVAQPVQGMTNDFQLKAEEVMLQIKCDVHPWMIGYVGVVPHPFFAVTGDEGTFTIQNVPPGKYVLQAWHEKYGALTQNVEVKAGVTVTVEFTYTGTEKAELNPGFILQELKVVGDDVLFRPVFRRK